MTKINDSTTVPFYWLIAAVIFCCGASCTGAYYVFTVDARLTRIERKMGINEPVIEAQIFNDAKASSK